MTITISIFERDNDWCDLTISPELSNYPIDRENRPTHISIKYITKDMVGQMVQKYIDKGGIV